MIDFFIIALIIALFFSSIRLFIGPTVWERLLALSLMSSKIMMIIILFAINSEQSFYIDIALVFAVLGFIGTTSLAQFFQNDYKNDKNN